MATSLTDVSLVSEPAGVNALQSRSLSALRPANLKRPGEASGGWPRHGDAIPPVMKPGDKRPELLDSAALRHLLGAERHLIERLDGLAAHDLVAVCVVRAGFE